MHGIGLRLMYGKFRFLRGREASWKEACREVHRVVDGWIDDALAEGKTRGPPDGSPTQQVILVNELAKQNPEDRVELRSQLINIFFPARDTTAIGVSDVFFNLARHPRVWDKLREEVLHISEPLTYELLQSLKYLRCVLNESQPICSFLSSHPARRRV